MKLHLPVRLFKSVLTCLSAVAVGVTLCSASVTAAETQLDNSPDEEELLLYPAPLTLTSSAVSLAAYTPPSEITIPTGYTEVLVDSVSDITPYSSSATDVAFRLTADVTVDGRTSAIMTSSADSWYFTSDSVDNLQSLVFSNATTRLFYLYDYEKLEFVGLAEVTFSGNTASYLDASAYGGAIYGDNCSTITLSGNGSVTFSGNTASSSSSSDYDSSYAYGGAIEGGTITLSGNGSVTFSGNTASSSYDDDASSYYYADADAYGGAIYGGKNSAITLSGNESVTFSGNSASSDSSSDYADADAYGGAIYGGENSTITLSGNGSVTFSGNTASSSSAATSYAYGGAIYGDNYSTITLSDNGSVTFSGNTASSDNGGAIYGRSGSTITLSGNGSVEFSGNVASSSTETYTNPHAYGGAIYGGSYSTITLSGNDSVTFSGNSASSSSSSRAYAYGGAIYGHYSTITLSDNGSVTFSGNSATSSSSYDDSDAYGGAIRAYGNLSIRNNDSVLFEKNAEVTNGTYRLRSIYAGGSGDTISLSTAKGKSIVFRDSVYIASGSTVNLNEKYTDAAGKVHKQTGDIIFTGAYTEQHLNELLSAAGAGRKATEEEILNSRTTVVKTMTNLYGGRLRVEDGAVYNGHGITAMDHSAATVLVKDATLNHAGYNLTFSSGTTLELVGNSKVYADTVQMMTGSSLLLDISRTEGVYILDSSLYLDGNMQLIPGKKRNGENIKLMFVSGKVDGWDDSSLTISGSAVFSVDDIQWVGHFLVANYHEATFRPYVYGNVTFAHRREAADYYFYESILFENCSTTSSNGNAYGGAIYGGENSTITLSGNDSVTFSGNTASSSYSSSSYSYNADAYGGAIYGGTITLSGNESVTFSGNSASSSYYYDGAYAYGGAIYGSAITLSGNGNVEFSENSASSSSDHYYAYGGAIYGGTITLSGNGSVTFSGNTASSSLASAYGGAIYGSTITLSGNGSVTFSENSVSSSSYAYGGAIYGDENSAITLSDNDSVTFSGNTASSSYSAYGGAIYGDENSAITLSDNDSVTFSGNSASSSYSAYGGAIYGGENSAITLSGNGSVTFSGNSASDDGGAIDGGTITLSDNGSVTFSGNSASSSSSNGNAYANGGAIDGGTITLSDNGSVTFSGNTASSSSSYANGNAYANGGAIDGSTITLSGNGSVEFSGNTASSSSSSSYAHAYGGAICSGMFYGNTITLSGNDSVTFSGNTASSSYANGNAYAYGGAIYGCTTLSGNGSVEFSGNTASSSSYYANAYGGAIYGSTTLSDNGSVTFSGNSARYGGAIYGSTITLSGNGSVEFSGNTASSSSSYYANAYGGAICSGTVYGNTITLSGNGSVTFSGNTASSSYDDDAYACGGAIEGSTITLSGNGSVEFSGNTASSSSSYAHAYGGAICSGTVYGNTITLSGNDSVTFCGNTASSSYDDDAYACGGAIYADNLSIRNNDSVLFEKNAEVTNGTYRLRSIYAGGSGDTISLSAAKGKSIEFRDSMYIASGSTVELNADYTDAAGKVHKQTGDIIFTGAYTEQHLNELLSAAGAGRTATEKEIQDSRTTVVDTMTNLYGGRLRVEDGAIFKGRGISAAEGSDATVQVKNAALNHETHKLTFNSGTTLSLSGTNSISGNIQMNAGSYLKFNIQDANRTSPLAIFSSASLTLGGKINIVIEADSSLKDGAYYQLFSGITKPSSWTEANVNLILPNNCVPSTSVLCWNNDILTFYCDYPSSVTWNNASGSGKWDVSSLNWTENGTRIAYAHHASVIFGNAGAGTVSLTGTLAPKSVTVNNGSGYNYTWQGSGKLSGAMKLYKKGAGTLTIKNTNTFTGGSYIYGGTVVLGANNALGSGAITLSNATLNMGGKITPNNLTLSGSSKILSGTNYRGNFTMNGNLLAGSSINIISGKTANLKKGNVGGTISGAGNTVINGAVTLNGGKITTNKLTISGSGKKLTANASGLVMNKNASDIVLSNSGNLTSAGAITARNITLSNKAVLNAKNSAVRNITLGGKLQATDSTVNMFGNLSAANLVLTRSTLTNNGSSVRNLSLSGALTLSSATLNHYGNISAKNVTATASSIRQTGGPTGMKLSGNLSLGSKSTLNLFGALNAANVTLSGNSVLNNANSTVRNAVVKGKLQATNSTVSLHGNLTAGNLVLNNATLRDNGSSARAVTVTNSTSLSNNAKLNIKGYLRSKNLTLNKSSLRQHSNNSGVALTGTLTMNSGSTLTVQGALSAANMKLSGGTINLTSASFNTIKVSGTLTLSSAIDLNLGCKLTTGRNYTLIRFNKTNLTSRNNLAKLLGLTGSGATLTLRSTGIILKVTNAAAWNKYLSVNKTAFNKAASVVNAITPAAEETEVVEIAANTATTVAAEPAYDRSSADMLVQSNWGVVNASRAFTDTLGNRASNSTAFGADKSSAVWLSAMGASSRLSSDGAAAGSDYNLFGAAVGMEQQLTEKSSLGLTIGESYGRVNSFTSARTKQDTLHTALYGQYSAVERSRDAVLLDWSAAYGRTESKWQGTEWEQKSVQLDARATWAHQLTADTTVSGFAGMQYFASESADIAPGIKSGSVQNLRGEIGVGIGHKATSKTTVYGELSFVGDMARNNPTAQTEGQRVRGANPGRAGLNFSVGGTHELNDRWSVNASYNMELMERANSHSANIGTSYRF